MDMMKYGLEVYFEIKRLGQKVAREYGENIEAFLFDTLKDCKTDDEEEMIYYLQDRCIDWLNENTLTERR